MTEPTPGATEPTPTEPAAAAPPQLSDDHAQALLADAIATADQLNQDGEPRFDGDFDPDRAATLIQKLRAEKAALKGSATKAAEAARQDLAQTIGKALGLVQDDTPPDPAALTQQLTAASAQAKQAQLELAVYRAAGDTADPIALIDSRAFMQQVAAIDPADTSAITQAITQAVTANPRLARSQAPRMQPNPAQGTSAQPPLGLNERIAEAEKAGDIRTAIRLKAAKAVTATP
ncbi:MAG TPA: hypothetical protein VFH54_10900 [Mycobacteriales bacterium]|nr:hypothetical protein [Mycobacteriales bacterium]